MRVIVIGAGIVGSSIAYHLVEQGVDVLAIDGRPLGGAASASTFACLNYFNYHEPTYFALRRDGIRYLANLATRIGAEIYVHGVGTLRWHDDDAGWEKIELGLQRLSDWEAPFQRLTNARLRELEPDIDFASVKRDAVWVSEEGWIDGVPFIGRLAVAASATKRYSFLRSEVSGWHSGRHGVLVETPEGAQKADLLVIAAGTNTGKLCADNGFHIPVYSDPGIMFLSPPSVAQIQHVIYAGTLHFRPDGGGRIIGGHHGGPIPEGLDANAETTLMAKQLTRWLPHFDSNSIVSPQIGIRPMPEDGYPITGWITGCPRMYVAACHSGMTIGPLLGKLCSSEILGSADRRLDSYRPQRFRESERQGGATENVAGGRELVRW